MIDVTTGLASGRASASEPGADGVWGRSPHGVMANLES